jgi:hypothetical protein
VRTCPWRTRSHRFSVVDHKSSSPKPIDTREDGNELIPVNLSSSQAWKDLRYESTSWPWLWLWLCLRCAGAIKEKGREVAEQQQSDRALTPASHVAGIGEGRIASRVASTASSCSLMDPSSKNVALLQFQTDDVTPWRASDIHRSHGVEGNRSRDVIGRLTASVTLIIGD